jgi:omega-6 fatty acid desaturase (delta-12 desaturase)
LTSSFERDDLGMAAHCWRGDCKVKCEGQGLAGSKSEPAIAIEEKDDQHLRCWLVITRELCIRPQILNFRKMGVVFLQFSPSIAALCRLCDFVSSPSNLIVNRFSAKLPIKMTNVSPTESAQEKPKKLPTITEWKAIVADYTQASTPRAVWQLVNTLVPFAVGWYLMYLSLSVSYWITLGLAILMAGLVVRIFIIFHDCGHGSFLPSKRANDIVGFITGVITFTPYAHWRWEHALHHQTSGDLDRRGTGDIWTLTIQEYIESSRWKRFAYRLARNPVILFVIAPLGLFLFYQRVPNKKAPRREKNSVWLTSLSILAVGAVMSYFFGFWTYVCLQVLITALSGAAGVWMFYVQHQFEDVYWERRDEWDYTAAAIEGSSFYKLPKILQWFTGNIGFHHIHHLSSRIPNYNLERCHHSHPLFSEVPPITMLASLKTISLRLWDEQQKKLVGYKRLREVRREIQLAKEKAAEDEREQAEAVGAMRSQQGMH